MPTGSVGRLTIPSEPLHSAQNSKTSHAGGYQSRFGGMYPVNNADVHASWLPDNESPRKIPDFLRQAAGVALLAQTSADRA